MPSLPPVSASGDRGAIRTPRIPKHVVEAVKFMVRGDPADPDALPLDFIAAGKLAGIRPDVMRRWLDRPEVIKLIRAERRAFRESICAGNELALKNVRDRSANGMAVINSVRTLEQLNEDKTKPGWSGAQVAPGLVVQIVNRVGPALPDEATIEIKPAAVDE